jgi:hypothetical protein
MIQQEMFAELVSRRKYPDCRVIAMRSFTPPLVVVELNFMFKPLFPGFVQLIVVRTFWR